MAQQRLRVGIVGLGFIANLHAAALIRLAGHQGVDISFTHVADVNPAARDGFSYECSGRHESYADVTRADDVDLVIVSVPNDMHADIVRDAVAHGKFVVCEKPLAAELDEAVSICSEVVDHGVGGAVAFVFRTWPTVELARQMIARGEIGDVFGYRGHMLHGHNLDPESPFTWRLDSARSGGGAVVDIGSHAIDIAQQLVGDVTSVSAVSRTLIPERPGADGAMHPVLVDDHTMLGLRFDGGATGQILVSWVAAGQTTDVAFEVLGTEGSIAFSWRRPEELWFARHGEAPRTLTIGPDDPDGDLRFPVAGLGLGYVDAFVSLHRRVLDQVLGIDGTAPPTFPEALQCAQAVDAAQRSAASDGAWVTVPQVGDAGAWA